MQGLIDESVGALFAAVVEQIHKFAQVSTHAYTQYTIFFPQNGIITKPVNSQTVKTMFFFKLRKDYLAEQKCFFFFFQKLTNVWYSNDV